MTATDESLRHLTDRELLVKLTVNQDNMQTEMSKLNGTVADLVRAKNFTYGALTMLGFLVTVGIPAVALIWNNV